MSVLKFESSNKYNVLKLKTSDLASNTERLHVTLSLSKNIPKTKPQNLETINEFENSEKGIDSDISSSPMNFKDKDSSFEFEFDEEKKNNSLEICEIIACVLDTHKCGVIYLNDIVNDLNSNNFYYSQIKSISDFLHSYYKKTQRVIIEVPYFIDKLYMAYCLKKFNLKNSLDLGIKPNVGNELFQKGNNKFDKYNKFDKRRLTIEKFVIKDNKIKDTYEYLDSIDKTVQKHSDQKKHCDELSNTKKNDSIIKEIKDIKEIKEFKEIKETKKKISCFSKNLVKEPVHSTNTKKFKESKKSNNSNNSKAFNFNDDGKKEKEKEKGKKNNMQNTYTNPIYNPGQMKMHHKIKVTLFNPSNSRKSMKSMKSVKPVKPVKSVKPAKSPNQPDQIKISFIRALAHN